MVVNKIKFSEVAPFNRYTLYVSKYDMLPNSVVHTLSTNNSEYNIDKILDYLLNNFKIDNHFNSNYTIKDAGLYFVKVFDGENSSVFKITVSK